MGDELTNSDFWEINAKHAFKIIHKKFYLLNLKQAQKMSKAI